MNNQFLTFEINDDQDSVEIHANAKGITTLIRWLELALKTNDHQHLMTSEWGGSELSADRQGSKNRLVHHVKIFPWKD